MKKWLLLFLGFLLILEVTQILLIFKAFEMHFSDLFFVLNVLRLFSIAGLIGLLISPYFFPVILYGMPRVVPQPAIPDNPGEDKTDPVPGEERKTTNHYEIDYLNSIGGKADSYMKEFQPYLQPDFSLAQLSVSIHFPVHHLGYFLREVKKQSFTDYRNEWRINHAKNLIIEGKIKMTTLESIGIESGFSNRNTFLTAFKRLEGTSPNAYVTLYKQQFAPDD